jgi:hypothetical protein
MAAIHSVHLKRHRYLPSDGGGTVFCTVTFDGSCSRALAFLDPGQFPEFEGEEAWFVAELLPRRKFRFIQQVESKHG